MVQNVEEDRRKRNKRKCTKKGGGGEEDEGGRASPRRNGVLGGTHSPSHTHTCIMHVGDLTTTCKIFVTR